MYPGPVHLLHGPRLILVASKYSLTSGTTVKVTYGYDAKDDDDDLVKLSVAAPHAVVSLGADTTNYIDLFPFCGLYRASLTFYVMDDLTSRYACSTSHLGMAPGCKPGFPSKSRPSTTR